MYRLLTKVSLTNVAVLLMLYAGWLSAAQADTARQVVENFQSQLLEVMKQGKDLGYQGRFDKLYGPVTDSHDLPKIARIVVGREWEALNGQQQAQLTDIFSRLSVASYAHNFKEFDNESFKFEAEEETARGGMIVHTYMLIPSDKDVKFDYMLKKKGNTWKIINIIANGVSDLALKRSEYTAILKREGFDALIAKINEKLENYSQQ
ncbi:MAG: ABC transporter substrate-binding protein [Gammaproteobacteria bacterium]